MWQKKNGKMDIEDVVAIKLEKDDIVCVKISRDIKESSFKSLQEALKKTFPKNKVIIFSGNISMYLTKEENIRKVL